MSEVRDGWGRGTYIGDTGDPSSLELATIQFLYRRPQVRSRLKLDEAGAKWSRT